VGNGSATGRLAVKVVIALFGTVVTALLAANSAGVWRPRRDVVIGLIATAAVLAVGSSTAAAIGEYRRQRGEVRREDVAFLLTGAAWELFDLTAIDPRELGLAVYVVRRERLLWWRRRLVRLHRERAARRPTASDVVWRPGKGVIGTCVARGEDVGQDTDSDYRAVWDRTRAEWDTEVPDTIKLGLSYDEWLRVRGKYGAVIATPIIDDTGRETRVVGCVALDGASGTFARLSAPDARQVLGDTARSLARWVL
jgi:hypothetical protein